MDGVKSLLENVERELSEQHAAHEKKVQELEGSLTELRQDIKASAQILGSVPDAGPFCNVAEWTITGVSSKISSLSKGESIWSSKFSIGGLRDVQLEFFPNGREKTNFEGFCSVFLWCPGGTRVKYRLFVGSSVRAPDEDTYEGRIGHGHSNFCPLVAEVKQDTVIVGVIVLEVVRTVEADCGLKLYSRPLESLVAGQLETLRNQSVSRVTWKINQISKLRKQLPKGTSAWSKIFTAAGIPDILLEFYPNGSNGTTKDGYCAFYIRCARDISVVVTLLVGATKKGPIKTTFDSLTGKGLPDFCPLDPEINKEKDCLEVGIEVNNAPTKVLTLES